MARFNRLALNRITRRLFPWLPGFGVIVHKGRRSGRTYRTPVNVFRSAGGYVVALTYGADSDWVKNVLAAQGCQLQTRRRHVTVGSVRLYHDESRAGIRFLERHVLGLLGVADFLALTPGDGLTPRP